MIVAVDLGSRAPRHLSIRETSRAVTHMRQGDGDGGPRGAVGGVAVRWHHDMLASSDRSSCSPISAASHHRHRDERSRAVQTFLQNNSSRDHASTQSGRKIVPVTPSSGSRSRLWVDQ